MLIYISMVSDGYRFAANLEDRGDLVFVGFRYLSCSTVANNKNISEEKRGAGDVNVTAFGIARRLCLSSY